MNCLKNKESNEMAVPQEQKKNKILLINVLLICCMYISTLGGYWNLAAGLFAIAEKRIFFIGAILLLGLCHIVYSRKFSLNGTILAGLFLAVYMVFMSINYIEEPLTWFSCVATWIIAITIFYNQKSSAREKELCYNILCLAVLAFSILYTIGYLSSQTKTVEGVNSIYYITTGVPFIFAAKNSKWSVMALLATSLAILISCKMICIFALLIAWSTVIYRKGWSAAQILKSIIGVGISVFFLWFVLTQFVAVDDIVYAVFDKINGGGSGREEIYADTFTLLGHSSIAELFCGHGYKAIDRALYIGSHNDFLMVLYNYGFIGLGLYLIFIIQLINDFARLRKQNSPYAFAFGISLVVFLCVSSTSNVLNTQIQLFLLAVFWGMTMPKREEIANAK